MYFNRSTVYNLSPLSMGAFDPETIIKSLWVNGSVLIEHREIVAIWISSNFSYREKDFLRKLLTEFPS